MLPAMFPKNALRCQRLDGRRRSRRNGLLERSLHGLAAERVSLRLNRLPQLLTRSGWRSLIQSVKTRSLTALAFALLLTGLAPTACSDDTAANPAQSAADGGGDAADPTGLTFSASPVTDLPAGARFAGAVPYGTDPMQVVDVFLPAATAPTAAVIYIHGGGFTKGARTDAYTDHSDWVRKVVGAGVAWISVEYRLLQEAGTEKEGVIKSLHDCQRALQFVRHSAGKWNIDPKRVGANGSSAGAGASMWLAFHDEMAKADSADPVEHASTRPQAIAVEVPQSTYDVMRWAPDLLHEEYSYVTNDLFLNQASLRTLLVQFYGLDISAAADAASINAAVNTPEMKAYRADVDMLTLQSSEDPPAYLLSDKPDTAPLDADFDLLHHPLHGKAIHKRGAEVGATVEANVPAYEISSTSNSMDFLLQHLGVTQ